MKKESSFLEKFKGKIENIGKDGFPGLFASNNTKKTMTSMKPLKPLKPIKQPRAKSKNIVVQSVQGSSIHNEREIRLHSSPLGSQFLPHQMFPTYDVYDPHTQQYFNQFPPLMTNYFNGVHPPSQLSQQQFPQYHNLNPYNTQIFYHPQVGINSYPIDQSLQRQNQPFVNMFNSGGSISGMSGISVGGEGRIGNMMGGINSISGIQKNNEKISGNSMIGGLSGGSLIKNSETKKIGRRIVDCISTGKPAVSLTDNHNKSESVAKALKSLQKFKETNKVEKLNVQTLNTINPINQVDQMNFQNQHQIQQLENNIHNTTNQHEVSRAKSANLGKSVQYTPYSIEQYNDLKLVNINKGGLGPNIGTDEWHKKQEQLQKQKEYALEIKKKHISNLKLEYKPPEVEVKAKIKKKIESSNRFKAIQYCKKLPSVNLGNPIKKHESNEEREVNWASNGTATVISPGYDTVSGLTGVDLSVKKTPTHASTKEIVNIKGEKFDKDIKGEKRGTKLVKQDRISIKNRNHNNLTSELNQLNLNLTNITNNNDNNQTNQLNDIATYYNYYNNKQVLEEIKKIKESLMDKPGKSELIGTLNTRKNAIKANSKERVTHLQNQIQNEEFNQFETQSQNQSQSQSIIQHQKSNDSSVHTMLNPLNNLDDNNLDLQVSNITNGNSNQIKEDKDIKKDKNEIKQNKENIQGNKNKDSLFNQKKFNRNKHNYFDESEQSNNNQQIHQNDQTLFKYQFQQSDNFNQNSQYDEIDHYQQSNQPNHSDNTLKDSLELANEIELIQKRRADLTVQVAKIKQFLTN